MKKIIIGIFASILMIGMVGCTASNSSDDNKIKIATTSHALAYFITEIGGDLVDVSYELQGNPHNFELTQQDANAISQASIFINVEVGDYQAIGNQIRQVNPSITTIDVSEGINLLLANDDHHHDHGDEDAADDHHHLSEEYDPHIWLDPIRAQQLVQNIANALQTIDATNEQAFEQNLQGLLGRLSKLNFQFEELLKDTTKEDILVAHAAYTYMANRYHFEQKGINSANDHSENTQQSIIDLDTFIKEHQIQYVLLEENVAETNTISTLIQVHKLKTLQLHNIETPQHETDYFVLMEENLIAVHKALTE